MTRQRPGVILLLAGIVLLFPSLARPDGRVFVGDRSAMRPLQPREQAAAIVQRDGVEKMVIALNFDAEDKDSALWIFPLPGTSSQTRVDIVDSFPQFWGRDPRVEAGEEINGFMEIPPATQLWPAILVMGVSDLLKSRSAAVGRPSVSGEVEKWGIHAEIISAKNVDELIAYLKEKQAGVEAEPLRAFEPYLAGGYVLVTAWMASKAEVLKSFPESQYSYQRLAGARRPALYVEFPTASAYFPLRPTAAYGDAVIPVRLYVAGYVEPRTNPALAGSLSVSYYQGGLGTYSQEGHELKAPEAFWNALGAGPVEYTTISYSGPARNFTDDLRFVPTHPFGMRFAGLVLYLGNNGTDAVLVLILLVAGLSYISAGLAGLYVRREWHRFAPWGLLNVLTIVGFLLGVVHLALREGREFRAFRFIAAFTITFVVLGLMLQLALLLLTGIKPSGSFG